MLRSCQEWSFMKLIMCFISVETFFFRRPTIFKGVQSANQKCTTLSIQFLVDSDLFTQQQCVAQSASNKVLDDSFVFPNFFCKKYL